MTETLDIVICGLSITSSWGNGHATTWRALVRGLADQGHRVFFLERDVPWYRDHRDAPSPPGCTLALYGSLDELEDLHLRRIRTADAVIVGSYVPEGVEVGRLVTRQAGGVTAFYDLDTPVTLAKLERGDRDYLAPELVGAYDLYLSSTGGPILDRLEQSFGARRALPLFCAVDTERYRPTLQAEASALGYLGTYSPDRQDEVERLLVEVARRCPDHGFVIGGHGWPDVDRWPANLVHRPHVPPADHPAFYGAQRFTLNVTRPDMAAAGWSPSVRLFEAAACGTPILTDAWDGLDAFFRPDVECLVVETTEDVLRVLHDTTAMRRAELAAAARRRVLRSHTAYRRAEELARYLAGARRACPGAVARRTDLEPA